MTLSMFVTKSALRNKRRTLLTMLGVAVSLGLLTVMMSVWKGFYLDKGSAESAQRLITRHKVSLTNFLPSYYAERIRAIPGVVALVPNSWFGGTYKDDKLWNGKINMLGMGMIMKFKDGKEQEPSPEEMMKNLQNLDPKAMQKNMEKMMKM